MWARRPRLPHTHTQTRRTIVPKRVATQLASGCGPGPDIATVWTCPTPVYTHTARLCTNNTHSQGHRAVCPSATHMSIRKRDRTKPGRNAATAAQTHWPQPTIWRGHTRSTTSPKKGKIRGYISKEFCAKTDLCPLDKPASQNRRWPSEGKGITTGWAVGISMNHWGVSPCCTNPPVAKAEHRNDTNTPKVQPNRAIITNFPRS